MNEANRKAPAHRARFEATVERLIRELHCLRRVFAAMSAAQGEYSSNLFMHVAGPALQTEMFLRLIRILEARKAASFWFLYRCEPPRIAEGIDIAKLQDFSDRLKLIRDKVFVHIDKDAVFDPQKAYQDAAISMSEIHDVIETLWTVIDRLYLEQYGRPFTNRPESSLDSIVQDFKRDFAELSER
jgi:hypothetical protein